ncbi:MAG: isocitrate/isopropylmalate dehydrogenase family protein [Nitrososphaerales archaeon]
MTRTYRISFIEGDGIGPEILSAGRSVLDTLGAPCNLSFEFIPTPAGDMTLLKTGEALPKESFLAIKESDACLKAPVGETAKETILKLRQELDLYANIRPARNYDFIESKFKNVDMVIVRENTEDVYVGREFEEQDGKRATALKVITERASKRIAKAAFELALARKDLGRGPSVVAVHKSNVLPKTDGLFVKSCTSVAENYPSVRYSTMLVDTAAMNLVRNPEAFDVMVTTNMYGDILSDEASQVAGGLGVAASANVSDGFALFEPVHGCAPDIAGKGIANPISMIFTIKMMLEWLGMKKNDGNCVGAAKMIDRAVSEVGSRGIMTPDIGGKSNTSEVARAICSSIRDWNEEQMESRGVKKMAIQSGGISGDMMQQQGVLSKW